MYIDYYKHNHNIIPSPAWSLVLNRGGFSKWRFCACAQLVTPRYRASVIGFYSLQETLERTCATRESLCWWKKWIGFNSRLSFMRLLMFLLVKHRERIDAIARTKLDNGLACLLIIRIPWINQRHFSLPSVIYRRVSKNICNIKKDTHKALLKNK